VLEVPLLWSFRSRFYGPSEPAFHHGRTLLPPRTSHRIYHRLAFGFCQVRPVPETPCRTLVHGSRTYVEPRPCWVSHCTLQEADHYSRPHDGWSESSLLSGIEPTWLTVRRSLRAIKSRYPLSFLLSSWSTRPSGCSGGKSETDRSRTPFHWACRPPFLSSRFLFILVLSTSLSSSI
jgi:hypothetical protein